MNRTILLIYDFPDYFSIILALFFKKNFQRAGREYSLHTGTQQVVCAAPRKMDCLTMCKTAGTESRTKEAAHRIPGFLPWVVYFADAEFLSDDGPFHTDATAEFDPLRCVAGTVVAKHAGGILTDQEIILLVSVVIAAPGHKPVVRIELC